MPSRKVNRRTVMAGTAAGLVAAPFVRGAYAAGKISVGFWDHWVPGANKASKTLCKEWAAKENVEVSIDYISSQGNGTQLKIAADSRKFPITSANANATAPAASGPRHSPTPTVTIGAT